MTNTKGTPAAKIANAREQATHKMVWGSKTEKLDGGGLASIGGYNISEIGTGDRVDFVPVSEWATPREVVAGLRSSGYESLGYGFLRK